MMVGVDIQTFNLWCIACDSLFILVNFLMRKLAILICLSTAPFLTSCVVGAISGAASNERSIGRSVDDASAAISLDTRLRRHGAMGGVSVEVADGLALLAGFVQTPEQRLDAERIAWSAPKVIKVANEIEVRNKKGLWSGTQDRWISSKIRTKIFTDRSVRSLNINIETRNRQVFLLGLARSKSEIERIVSHARLTRGVKQVVSYLVTPETRATEIVPSEPGLLAEEELLGGPEP